MKNQLARAFLGIAAALLLLGVALHTSAFPKVQAAVGASNLAPFFGLSLQGLWLIDSITLSILALVFAAAAFRPSLASGALVALLALMPLGTSITLYLFLGSAFPAAHLLLVVGLLALVAGIMRVID